MCILIKNGHIVTGESDYISDLLIKGNKICKIEKNIDVAGDIEVIDAKDCFVFAGFIDPHIHFDLDNGYEKTADNFKTGTLAALMGGTTSIIDFATQGKGESLQTALKNWHRKAENVSSCNYGFHMAITDYGEDTESQMEIMQQNGVTSYKVYMAYDNLMLDDSSIYKIMRKSKELGSIVSSHCENGIIADELVMERKLRGETSPFFHHLSRPDYIEAEAVNRFLYIASIARSPAYIVHLSTKKGLKEAISFRKRGQKVYIETCPQYLILDDSKYSLDPFESTKYVISPPLRKKSDLSCLWEHLSLGNIDTLGTDHCSFNVKGQKETGIGDFTKIPNGMPGVKNRAELLYTYGVCKNKISINRMTEVLSENPSKIFGMAHERGYISEGKIADIVIFDPRVKEMIDVKNSFHNVDYSPYEGMEIRGKVRDVILNGEVAVRNYAAVLKNKGAFLFRKESSYV